MPNGIVVEYAYDAASRVTEITYKQNGTTVLGNLTYDYDKNGNRTQVGGSWARTGVPQTIATTTYDANNRQLTFGDKTLGYDDNGNLQSITDASGTTIYQWNARNQLAAISGPDVNASFVYDGMGRREKKTINSNLTEFLYDGVNPVQESSGVTILANILTEMGIDEYLIHTDISGGITRYLLPDALGSTVALADAAGAVDAERTYEPFGNTSTAGASNTSSYQYTGRENDGTGLYYFRARYFHPVLQRFSSEDPIGFNGGDVNLYAYVTNNPNAYVDPWGLKGGSARPWPPDPLVRPNPFGEAIEWGEKGISEIERQQGQQSELGERMDLEREIRKKLSELDFECDTWVEVCWRLKNPKGTVRIYLKHRLKPAGIICQWRLVEGRTRNCCDANPG